ncbi:DUF6049 family protein [Amycolatopsis acidiphila]|uniref:Glycoprotein n=1 Tax=Amycolatopsis acidiphila TaxID=715473 RepID=A0A558A2C7_9PSEU|nr:DUF6049 family protein [Amycolatopsis acidiphila]TVT18402.1 hypothetical protein FNH06_27875 [Amycolatopsis acidiphila]UIJ60117.1 DUF6049 family protein [Amycolatopsis acidiphila]GHG61282.1 glycoprotein [Amycolatopsis acidiphila]
MKRFAAVVSVAILIVLLAPLSAGAQPVTDTPSRLRLDVTQMNPRTLTSTSTTLNITGTVTNIGDRRISDLQVRLELGERLGSERQVRTALSGTPATAASNTRFVDIDPGTLEPGQTGQLNITVHVDGTGGGLRVNGAGVYPLLVNVNGTPDYGDQARLASMSLLLPVLGAPGKAGAQPPGQPSKVTMLWPIADTRPRIVAAPFNGKVVLGDDVLASELRPGGRLYALVSSALAVRDEPQVSKSLCYAVDPDLLDTVDGMSRGYEVRTPTGNIAGGGVDAAKAWLASLRELVANQCVIQLPYADADLSALSGVRGGDLMNYALNTAQHVQQLIGAQPLPGVLWADGPLDPAALASLQATGIKTLIADPADISGGGEGGVAVKGTSLRAQPVDSLVSTGLTGASGNSAALTPPQDPAIGAQNGLATLAYRGLTGGGDSVLVAPPRRWSVPESELTQLLQALGDLLDHRMLTAASLPQVLNTAPTGTASMNYTAEDVASATPASVTGSMGSVEATMADIRGAMAVDPTAQVDPDQLLMPLRYALVRNCSTAWQGSSDAAEVSANDSRTQLHALLGQVTVDTPAVPISLASGSAPLPVFLQNMLPVQVTVRITLNNSTGLRTGDIDDQLLPAGLGANRKITIPAEALRAGRFSVTVALSTPGGTQLGNPARFELRSNQYGVVTLVLTIAGGVALVLLSGRQIYRRVRARGAR